MPNIFLRQISNAFLFLTQIHFALYSNTLLTLDIYYLQKYYYTITYKRQFKNNLI